MFEKSVGIPTPRLAGSGSGRWMIKIAFPLFNRQAARKNFSRVSLRA